MEDSLNILLDALARAKNVNEKYIPQTWAVLTRYSCPYTCNHCFFSCNPNDKVEISDELLDNYVKATVARKITGEFIISGGEPMLNPEQVFRTIRTAKEGGLIVDLGSSFLGYTKEEIEENARILGELGLKNFWGSISASHYKSHPVKKINMSYQEYQAAIFDAVTRHGIELIVKTVFDPENKDLVAQLSDEIIFRKLNIENLMIDPLGYGYTSSKNGVEVSLHIAPVITVGRAREKRLSYGSDGKLDYTCPATDTRMMMGGALTLYPDGNVARCCSAERGADFGFGNANETSIEDIINNIAINPLLNHKFAQRLKLAHKIMQNEFPQLLPTNGAKESCEICSPMVSHPEVKERLKQEKLFSDCF